MKKFYLFSIICVAFLVFAPLATQSAFAQTSSNTNTRSTNTNTATSNTNTSSSTSTSKDFGLSQTTGVSLPDQSPAVFVGTLIRWVMGMLGVLLVGLFVYGGITYATAAGNDQRASDAKRILTYAVIGTVIVVAAAIISEFVINALVSSPTNTPVISNNNSQGSGASGGSAGSGNTSGGNTAARGSVGNPGSGVSAANPTNGNSSASNNTRLPPTNTRGVASICVAGSTPCEVGLQCIREPAGVQSYCLIPRNKPCNTNTTSAVGTNGCEFNTRCVKKSNPVDASGLPDFSQPDGVCE